MIEVWTLIVGGKRVGFRAEGVYPGGRVYGPKRTTRAEAVAALRVRAIRSSVALDQRGRAIAGLFRDA